MGGYYILKTDVDVLKFLNTLKGGDFVDVCIVHKISDPILVEDITELDPTIQTHGHGSGLNARADVSSPNNDINKTENDKDKGKKIDINGEIEESDESEGNNFSSYHLQTSESHFDEDFDDYEGSNSLFEIDKNIEECSDLEDDLAETRQSKINKKKDAQVSIDEIPSGTVGIDSGFEDMHKNKREKYEGKLEGDDQYFNSSDPGSECNDDERELVISDKVSDAPARNPSKKVYFDTGCKKKLFKLYMIFENVVQFREVLQTYSIQKGVNLKLKPNERERVRANCTKKSMAYSWQHRM
ncbi:uncharacterized protein [Nicotiana tomentosiformis]|uniref:uncharacterized protein n=1 Tax=Nicotiana tomentosiformis TaxID=4098 RepID=UPI00388CCD09